LIFQTEKQLTELGDKITPDQKAPIEAALGRLKEAHKMQDLATIDTAMNELNQVFSSVAQNLYQNPGSGAGADSGQGANTGGSTADDVTDVEFEEVNDSKK
jgi:molecular chaperone DnaK